jgi:hypothetical protein
MKTFLVAAILCAFSGVAKAGGVDSLPAPALPASGWSLVLELPHLVHVNLQSGITGIAVNFDGWNEVGFSLGYNNEDVYAWERKEVKAVGWRLSYRRYLSKRDSWTLFAAVYAFATYRFSARLRLSELASHLSLDNSDVYIGTGPGFSFFPLSFLELSAYYAMEFRRRKITSEELSEPGEFREISPVVKLDVKLHL